MVKIANQFDKNLFNSQKQKELYQLKFPDLLKIIITQKTNIQTYLLLHKSEFSLQSLYFYIEFLSPIHHLFYDFFKNLSIEIKRNFYQKITFRKSL